LFIVILFYELSFIFVGETLPTGSKISYFGISANEFKLFEPFYDGYFDLVINLTFCGKIENI